MNLTSQWKNRFLSVAFSILIVSQMCTSSHAFGQVNSLRPIVAEEEAHAANNSQNNSSNSKLGASIFETESLETFQSSLKLPVVDVLTQKTETNSPRNANRIDLSAVVGQVAQATVIVVLFCIASLFLIRKFKADRFFAGAKNSKTQPETNIQSLGSIRLAGNRSLELVEADGKRLVVLSGAGEASSLLLLDDDSAAANRNLNSLAKENPNTSKAQTPVFSLPFETNNAKERLARMSL